MNDLIYYADVAQAILRNETKYTEDKKLISSFFHAPSFWGQRIILGVSNLMQKLLGKATPTLRKIILRLVIIDSYYSTQMSKRLFGIEDIAERIVLISKEDLELRRILNEYICNGSYCDQVDELFSGCYGLRKTGRKAGRAPSLISKYAYFLTNYRFPIYDSLVPKSYELIMSAFPNLNLAPLPKDFDVSYFQKIKYLNRKSKVNDFDKLDNLLWLAGKYINGSLSLVISKERYLKLIENIQFPQSIESAEVDERIRDFIKQNLNSYILKGALTDDMIEFIRFCFQ